MNLTYATVLLYVLGKWFVNEIKSVYSGITTTSKNCF